MRINTKRFFRTIILAVSLSLCGPAQAGLATVGAVHDYVRVRWGIEMPLGGVASNLLNMRYLMQLVDVVNEKLNRITISDYANNERYATAALVADSTARAAVDELIRKLEYHFFFTPATEDKTYAFQMSAAGTFYIDWGDGIIQRIDRSDVKPTEYSHEYADAASGHEIALAGTSTGYAGTMTAAISFYDGNSADKNAYKIKSMRGCLGCLFPTLEDGSCPHFYFTFANNSSLTGQIPEDLFKGLRCSPGRRMFSSTFAGCIGLTGAIPANLFSGISGVPEFAVFNSTFKGCSGLSGQIPDTLFSGVRGVPVEQMFANTFNGCSGLSGEIPKNLFVGIEPTGDFKDQMFSTTFKDCNNLNGPSAKIGDKYLYEIWPGASTGMYSGVTGLSDYACIPTLWGGAGTKQPGECEPAEEEGGDGGD